MLDGIPASKWLRHTSVGVLLLLLLLTWAISHRYGGLFHDALLYTLQCAARLNPESLSHDVFLAYGSQDRFTLFSPLFAGASRLLGIESAATSLTLVLQAALLGGAWVLARSVMPARAALLGLLVFAAIPGTYGAERVFACIENFLTPRMAAEALVLMSLAAALHARRLRAVALLGVAVMLHPLMAGAGVAAFMCLAGTPALLLAAVTVFALAAAAFGALHAFDPIWLHIVQQRSPYLFLSDWTRDDALRGALCGVTLVFGAAFLPDERARSLCRATFATALSGILLTALLCDGAHLVLFTQLQPWRWMWLATAVSALILPQLIITRLQAGSGGIITAAALVAAWLFGSEVYCLAALLAACGGAMGAERLKPAERRLLVIGACGLLLLAATFRLANELTFSDAYWMEPTLPMWLRRTVSLFHDGCVPVSLAALAYGLARAAPPPAPSPLPPPLSLPLPLSLPSPLSLPAPAHGHSHPGHRARLTVLVVMSLAAMAGLAIIAPSTAAAWRQREFRGDDVARFAAWRLLIPTQAQVFWPESPLGTWLLLERAQYLSVAQTSGVVFSRAGALEMQRRAQSLNPPLPPQAFMSWAAGNGDMNLSRDALLRTCATHAFEFLATAADLGIPEAADVSVLDAGRLRHRRLYDCRERR